ncbi:MAG: hypothetical protein IPJ46_15575 [Anaerolineales bacterium]|nr:hypothetical protein [Anaerolineales bacterium]
MKITRDVITDLLPVYLSGEASADTKALIESFLQDDPEFAKLIGENDAFLPDGQINLSKDTEMDTLNKTKKLLRDRSTYLAFTIFFLLLPASFRVGEAGFQWLWADMPLSIVFFWLVGSSSAFNTGESHAS